MGDIFQEKADRDLFFSTFGTDVGSQLEQLKFEYEEIESGKLVQPTETVVDGKDPSALENKIQLEIEKNNSDGDGSDKEQKDHHSKTYTMIRAFSTVSLMTNFKTGFWKRKRGSKKNNEATKQRRGSTSSTPETNNNLDIPKVKVDQMNDGRSTIYSTVPRKPKNSIHSHTMSPSRTRPTSDETMPQQLQRSESGNVFIPPVIMDGQVVYDYQYATPEVSPKHEEKFYRRNSITRLLRIKKSPKKSPKKNTTPIKQLYEKTVLTASNPELHQITTENDKPTENGDAKHQKNGHKAIMNGKSSPKATATSTST